MAQIAVALQRVIVDNQGISIMPGSFKYTEGQGERTVEPQSAGGGVFENVISDDGQTHKSKFSFSMRNTKENIELARIWKTQLLHAVQWADIGINRAFNNAVLLNDYEINLSPDGAIELEWESDPVV
jgi:hypothetical protein